MLAFYTTLLEHFVAYGAILLATLGLLYLLVRRHVFSLFDPLLYYFVFTEAFCVADVVFMAVYGVIEARYFVGYLLTEGALFAGFLVFRPASPAPRGEQLEPIAASLRLAARGSFALLVGLNLLVYAQRGIPLFMENRLETYAAGGWGLASRLLDVLLVIVAYYLLEVLQRRNLTWRHWAALFVVVLTQVFTGAKSAVLGLVFIVSLHGFISGGTGARTGRMLVRLATGAVAAFLFIAAFQSTELELADTAVPPLGQAALRLINNGDAFINSYPDGLIEELDGSRPFQAVFREYIGAFRIVDADRLPIHVGVQISRSVFGVDSTTQTNAKHNVFGYVYFGPLGAVAYSLLLGVLVAFVRYRLLPAVSLHWMWGVIYITLNLSFAAAANEWDGASRAVINAVLLLVVWGIARAVLSSSRITCAAPETELQQP
jgi:hypothetical protein